MSNYLVLIGDIKKSRDLEDKKRQQVQKKLETLLNKLNEKDSAPVSPFTITLGDEFQSVYKSSGSLFQHIWMILSKLHPVSIRFSVAIGEINTPLNRKQAIGMDGPSFHKAREGIEILKKEDGGLFRITYDNGNVNRLVNGSLKIISSQMDGWKTNRFQILSKLSEGKSVKQIAAELKLSNVAVYKNINKGSLEIILELSKVITEVLNDILKTNK